MGRLEGIVALISGAAAGIGEGIARAFISEGAVVMLTDIQDAEGQRLAGSLGTHALYRRLDVRQESEWSSTVQAVLKRYGRLDVVVNNAGITGFEGSQVAHDPEHADLEDWRAVLATNLDGTFLGCKVCNSGDEKSWNRLDHQHILTFRAGGDPRCCSLRGKQSRS